MSLPATLTVVEHAESFWVQNASGQTVGWFRTDPLVAKTAGVLHKDEARRMAVNFARLPELVGAVAGLDQGQEPGQPGDDPGAGSFRAVGTMTGRFPPPWTVIEHADFRPGRHWTLPCLGFNSAHLARALP